jgi:hypothetical protein
MTNEKRHLSRSDRIKKTRKKLESTAATSSAEKAKANKVSGNPMRITCKPVLVVTRMI